MCRKIIGYYYNNVSCPYHVNVSGSPKFYNKGFKKIRKSLKKKFEVVDESVKISYQASDGLLSISPPELKSFPGDLEADEVNSFYLGRHIVRNGDRKQTFTKSPDPMFEFFHTRKKYFEEFGVDIDKSIIVNGCFKTNKEVLQRTMCPEVESVFSSQPSLELIKKKEFAIKTMIRKLRIPQLAKCKKDDMSTSYFDLKTYPGFSYKEYLGFETKEEALDVALHVAKRRWDNIESCTKFSKPVRRNYLFPNTFTVGARNKRESSYENGERVNSRSVHMPEFHGEICDAPWLDQITEYIKLKGSGPIYIGNSIKKYERLASDIEGSVRQIEGDVKRFDASLYIVDIIIAVAISRLYYDIEDESIDNHFIAIFDSVGIKDYITPGGYLYRLIHGLPSGVKGTSLYGSYINLMNLIHCNRKKPQKKTRYIVGSDDFLIISDVPVSESYLDEVSKNGEEIGYRFKILSLKDIEATSLEDRPVFFKYTLDRGEPVVPASVIYERTLLPSNKKYKTNLQVFKFLHDLIPSLGAPRSHCILFYHFYCLHYERCFGRRMSIEEVFRYHQTMFDKLISDSLRTSDDSFKMKSCINTKASSEFKPSKLLYKLFKTKFYGGYNYFPQFVLERNKLKTLRIKKEK